MRVVILLLIFFSSPLFCAKHIRDGSNLPQKQQEFAMQLSLQKRRIFCGRFNESQRLTAIKYTRGRGKDQCCTPDEAVRKVMEETGMSLASKGRNED